MRSGSVRILIVAIIVIGLLAVAQRRFLKTQVGPTTRQTQVETDLQAKKIAAGKSAWQIQMCWYCHGRDGEGGFGPDLAGRELSLDQFKHQVRQPWGIMPRFSEAQVSDETIADLHTFFGSLPRVAKPGKWHQEPAP